MQNTSDRFLVACQESGTRIAVADLYYNRSPLPILTDLKVVTGSLTIDSTAAQRTSGTMTLAETDLIDLGDTATLQPYGVEIGIRMGVQYPDGTQELIQMGIFLITDLTYNEEEGNVPTITFIDRSEWLNEQSSKTGVEDYSGKSTFFAIQDLMSKSVFVNVTNSTGCIDPGSVANNSLNLVIDKAHLDDIIIPGGSPMDGGSFWDDIQAMASSLGAEIFFSEDGVNVILQKVPDLTTQSVADADIVTDATGDRGVIITSATGLSRIGSYNAVQMTGALPANAAATATPPTVFVYDNNPASATYYDITGGTQGPFGRVVYAVTSDTLVGIPALTAAATALLKKGLGLTKTLSYTMLPNPAVQCGDIHVVRHETGLADIVMVTTIGIDIGSQAAMSIGTKCANEIATWNSGTGVIDGGGGGQIPQAPIGATTRSYKCKWSQSYLQNLHQTNGGSSTFAYQGNVGGSIGNRFSMLGFDWAQIQTDLSGKIIVSCSLTLYFQHWWNNSGTALIGTTNSTATSAPTLYPSGTITGGRVNIANWPRLGLKTINLGITIGQEFQGGLTTGLILGSPGVNTNKLYYGYASGFGATHPPVLTIVSM